MIVNDPETLAEVTALFSAYERALVGNDVAALDGLFYDAPQTIRYGVAENLYGYRGDPGVPRRPSSAGLARTLTRTEITTYGRDFAIAATLFPRSKPGKVGRQMQTWVRFPEGWLIVAAHVSVIDDA